MVNRNRGQRHARADRRTARRRAAAGLPGEARSHNAVAAAVAQGRADWGVAIAPVAAAYGLGFLPLRAEHYDFVVPAARLAREEVRAFRAILADAGTRDALTGLGFRL